MEKFEILKIPFYKFKVHDSIKDDVYEKVTRLNFKQETMKTNGFVFNNFFHEGLFNFFENSIKEVQKLYYNDNLEFPIVDCWVNKFSTMNNLSRHAHSNSVISGVYYVTGHDDANTVFEMQDPWTVATYNKDVPLLNIVKNSFPIIGQSKADAGTLVLFPPSLHHYMKTFVTKGCDRYTVAFNAFPSGDICDLDTRILSIKTVSLRDRLGQTNKTGNQTV